MFIKRTYPYLYIYPYLCNVIYDTVLRWTFLFSNRFLLYFFFSTPLPSSLIHPIPNNLSFE